MRKLILLLFTILNPIVVHSQAKVTWGWETHRYINEHAVDYLPDEMNFFQSQRSYLRQHSIDPDTDPLPGYYHYIDIDNYPEFHTGTLAHDMEALIALHSLSFVNNNGIVPWIVEQWTDSLSTLMAEGDWDNVWQIAAELGHYVADSHQPLHLTLNYDGQYSGNSGIHSRFETQMINSHLSELALPEGTGEYWPNVIDSVFLYIDQVYSYVDTIMIADDLASAQDNSYGTVYYNILWQELENVTKISTQKSILDLASLWITAWEKAGKPSPFELQMTNNNTEIPAYFELKQNYPNPFNPATSIKFSLPKSEFTTLKIYDALGQKITTLISEMLNPGMHTYTFQGNGWASGVYYYQLLAGDYNAVKKMILLR